MYRYTFLCTLDERGFPPIVIIINIMKTPLYAFVVMLNTTGIVLSIACLIII